MPIDETPAAPSVRWHTRWLHLTPRRCLAAACVFFVTLVAIGTIPGYAHKLSHATDDRLLHFAAYASLSGLIFNGLTGLVLSRALGTLLMIALLGAIDEAIQSFMRYRTASLADWYINMLAALACIGVLLLRQLNRSLASEK